MKQLKNIIAGTVLCLVSCMMVMCGSANVLKASALEEVDELAFYDSDLNPYDFHAMKEEVIVLVFGRSTCSHTVRMTEFAAMLQAQGRSIKVFFGNIDDESGTEATRDHRFDVYECVEYLPCITENRWAQYALYRNHMDELYKGTSISLPDTYILDKDRNVVFASRGSEIYPEYVKKLKELTSDVPDIPLAFDSDHKQYRFDDYQADATVLLYDYADTANALALITKSFADEGRNVRMVFVEKGQAFWNNAIDYNTFRSRHPDVTSFPETSLNKTAVDFINRTYGSLETGKGYVQEIYVLDRNKEIFGSVQPFSYLKNTVTGEIFWEDADVKPLRDMIDRAIGSKPSESGASWKKSGKKWWYRYADGTYPANKWAKIDGKWYRFDRSGYMQTGWTKDSGKWYYLGKNGAMRTGWTKVSGKWYYLGKNGIMRTGWVKSGGNWYYMKKGGEMASNETLKIGGVTYFFDEDGVMQ